MALIDQINLANDPTFQARVRMAWLNYIYGTVFAETTNDVQTISITGGPTGGSFTLANGPLNQAVAPAFNDTAGVMQGRLQAAIDSGNTVFCSGGPLPGTGIIVTFTGNLADSPQNVMTISNNSLTGGSTPTPSVAHTTTGVAAILHSQRKTFGAKVVLKPDFYDQAFSMSVTTNATVMSDYTGGGSNQSSVTDAHIATAVAVIYNAFIG